MKTGTRKLQHTKLPLPEGGKVFVLETGADIHPEAEAMLQALHSRSIGGIEEHLRVLEEKGSDTFMRTYYVGYGHKSIGDCGSATVFVEGISMLAAKAIQDWPLYSGQESSTRYIDFATQHFINPLASPEGEAVQEQWRTFYLKGITMLKRTLKTRFPLRDGENASLYEKAITARSFDTMRAFLPAGAVTNIAWHMNLRQFGDALLLLRHHPLAEVRDIATVVEDALLSAYPNSFSKKRYTETEDYHERMLHTYYHTDPDCPQFALDKNNLDTTLLKDYSESLSTRPQKTELPRYIAECGTLQFRFLLDFGSFRDLQRHRSLTQRMPLLTTDHGFHSWYLDELPEDLRKEALQCTETQTRAIKKLSTTPEIAQYYTAMGYMVPNRLTGDLRALVYLAELRGTRFVHPTLRMRAREIANVVEEVCAPLPVALHMDTEPDRFDVERGAHDIVAR